MEIPNPIKSDLEKIGGINGLVKNLSKIFHGLSDKYRLKILMLVNKQPVCVCIMKEILQIADSKLSYHLSSLKENSLIYGKQQGNWIIYYPTKLGKTVLGLINDNISNL